MMTTTARHILVVDDEREIADLVELYLQYENFQVTKCTSSQEAMRCIEQEELDLAILDVMLPGMSGLGLCQRIRERFHYPIIMLSAKDQESDKITGLTFGADDYITKPFKPLELVARVKAQLRRYTQYQNIQPAEDNLLVHGGLVLDVQSHQCFLNERPLALTPTEFSILRILCENKGAVMGSEQLFHLIWGEEYYSKRSNTISVHIRHLREKMGDAADKPRYIKTVWGVGYKIDR